MNKNIRARKIALNLLIKVFFKHYYSNKVLNNLDKDYLVMDKDKKLIYKIVYGTIQNKIFLKFFIDQHIKVNRTDKTIQVLLWLSFYQLYFLDKIPPYAVINEAVEIAKKIRPEYGNFVNAILNKILRLGNIDKYFKNINLPNEEKKLIKYSMPN